MPDAVIELDISKPWAPEPSAGQHRTPILGAVLLMVAVGVVMTGPVLGAGRPFAFSWRSHTLAGQFWATSQSVFTIDVSEPLAAGAPRPLTLTARDPALGHPQWMVRLTGVLAANYGTDNHLLLTDFPPSFEQGLRTTIMDTRNGLTVRAYPTTSAALAYIGDEVAVIIDRDPEVREVGQPRQTEETGLDRAHMVEARDLRSGAVRWIRRLAPGTMWHVPGVMPASEGVVGLPPGENWMVTYTAAGLIETWDLNNGDTLATTMVGPLSQQSYVLAQPGAVLVRLKSPAETSLTAYRPEDLRRLWRNAQRDLFATPSVCGPLVCLHTDTSTWGLDTRTGTFAWHLDRPKVRPAAPGARVLVPVFGEQLALFDPETGDRRGGDGTWRVVDVAPYASRVVLAQPKPGGTAVLGLLDLAGNTVRRLGTATPFSSATQCVSAGEIVACEDGEGLVRVWRLR
jgi:PQQ-like domain